jgi:hypothetical protein
MSKYVKVAMELNSGWRLKEFELHVRKSLYTYEWIFKGDSGEDLERKEESCRESLSFPRVHLNNPEQNAGRNMNSEGHPDEISDGNEEHAIGHWRKGGSCYKMANNLVGLCSCLSV